MVHKAVLFLSPELEDVITKVVSQVKEWDFTVISSDPSKSSVDLTDVDALTSKLTGIDTCVILTHTDFTQPRQAEVQIGCSIGEACKIAAVPHVIVSGQVHCEKTIGIPARHYDAKAEIYQYYRFTLQLPVTMISIPPLYELFYSFLCPVNNKTGGFDIVFPSVGPALIDFISAEDIGFCLLPIIDNPQIFIHKSVCLSGDKLRGDVVTKLLTDRSGIKFSQRQVTVQDVRDRPIDGAIDLANMFELLGRAPIKASTNATREIYPHLQSFNEWLDRHLNRLIERSKTNTYSQHDPVPIV